METILIIIGILIAIILFVFLVTYIVIVINANRIKNRAEKFLTNKSVETLNKICVNKLKNK